MRCYYHPGVEAISHCVVCAKPLCGKCQVVVAGKAYCKQDAERLLKREDRVKSLRRRGIALSIAALLDVTQGLAGTVVGFLLVIIGLLAPAAHQSNLFATTVEPFLDYFSAVLAYSPAQSLVLGFVLLMLGTAEIVAGYYLWRRSRPAALASIAISILSLALIAGYESIMALAGAFTFIHVGSVVAKLIALGYGWPHLKSRGFTPPRQAKSASSQAPTS